MSEHEATTLDPGVGTDPATEGNAAATGTSGSADPATASGGDAIHASEAASGPAEEPTDVLAGSDAEAPGAAGADDLGDAADDFGEDDDDGDGDDEEGDDADGTPGGAGERAPRASTRDRTAQLEREGEVAADFLERLLDIADLDGDIDVDVDGDRAAVAIVDSEDGRVPRRLVGTDGKVLEALQELTRLAVQASTGDRSRLMLDVAGHRASRRRIVLGEAREAISQIRGGAEKVALEPMTAFERKVVHDEILAAGYVSESDGVEPRRYVVVYPN
jgi:spoIIIJ-associated protein